MMSYNKYNARPVYWDLKTRSIVRRINLPVKYQKSGKLPQNIVYFASTFEFKVYQALVKLYGVNAVICQYPLPIIKEGKCCPLGKDWRIDFAIKSSFNETFPSMLIEAKGYLTETFTRNLAFLEQTHPLAFERFYLFFERTIPTRNRLIRNLMNTDARDRILTLTQFIKMKEIPHEVY